jgi:hypothetical protein
MAETCSMTRSEGTAAGTAFSLSLLFLLALAVPARAAERDEAGARVLFGEGRKLADDGHYAEACLKFEESLRLDPGVGTSFNLADCQEHLGRTATAWTRFLEVAAATKREGQLERARVAQARADALEPKLARWVLTVSAPAPGLVVARDGLAVGAAAWGVAVPVDPGPHRVEATAPDRQSWSREITVPDGPSTTEVSVPALEALPPPAIVAAPPGPASRGAPASLVEAPATQPTRWPPRASVAMGVLGMGALAAGAYFGLQARSENDQAKKVCDPFCPSVADKTRHDALVDDARRDQTLAIVSASVGAAVLLTGAYVWWHRDRATARPPVTPAPMQLAGGALGVHLEGAW